MHWNYRKVLSNPTYENIQYLTTKGYMKGVAGSTWTLTHQLPNITWFPPNAPQQSCLSQLNQTLEYDVNTLAVMVPGDFYYWGGSFARAARMALIAEHIGRNDLVNTVVNILKQSFAYWLDPTHQPGAGYETGWGGFINAQGWNNTWVDFGNVCIRIMMNLHSHVAQCHSGWKSFKQIVFSTVGILQRSSFPLWLFPLRCLCHWKI